MVLLQKEKGNVGFSMHVVTFQLPPKSLLSFCYSAQREREKNERKLHCKQNFRENFE
jgi:hypothetical protein